MRKVEIPIIYSVNTGEWLNICGLTYDTKENIVEVEAWDGDGVITFEKGEFKLDEDNIAPLYQKNDKLKNFQLGLKNFTDRCKKLEDFTVRELLTFYGSVTVLVDKSMNSYSEEVAYPAQNLQSRIQAELMKRVK